MGVQVSNNAVSSLAGSINTVVTSMSVQPGHGARFPAATVVSGNYFYVTLIDAANNIEIVKVTDRSTDTFTIVRARDGTTARSFAANDRVELRPVAALFNELPNRQMQTADIADLAVTSAKLATMGSVAAGTYGGAGMLAEITVNSKGLITAAAEVAFAAPDVQTFNYTGSSQTWNKPATGTWALIQMWGGGGGGARAVNGDGGGGGGGSGYKQFIILLSSLAATATVSPGIGGAAGASNGAAGTDGGNSTFVSGSFSFTAWGGKGGDDPDNAGNSGGYGGGLTSALHLGGSPGTSTPSLPGYVTEAWYGGGGGGGSGGVSGTYCTGASTVFGGAGGGGAAASTDASNYCVGGTSEGGGAGGRGSVDIGGGGPISATAGVVPGGGGGGSENSAAGDGAHGRVTVTVF